MSIERVRFYIGDDKEPRKYADAQIQIALDEAGDWQGACLKMVDRMIADLTWDANMSSSGYSVQHTGRLESLQALKSGLERQFGRAQTLAGVSRVETSSSVRR